MMGSKRLCWKLLLAIAAVFHFAPYTLAQPPEEPVEKAGQWRTMKLRHVRPTWMAWWLDPVNNLEPVEIRHSRLSQSGRGNTQLPDILGADIPETTNTLPKIDGIQAVRAFDVQNEIIAFGDDAGWEELQRQVRLLDQPIKTVEITLHEFEITEQDLVQVGWKKNNETTATILKFPTKEFENTLQSLRETGRVKIFNNPRVTAMNNVPASLGQSQLTPTKITLDTVVTPASKETPGSVAYPASQFMSKKERRLTVTPTVNNDGSVTLMLNLAEPLYLVRASQEDLRKHAERLPQDLTQSYSSFPELLLDNGNKLTTIVNLHPNETLQIAGLATETLVKPSPEGVKSEQNTTYRIVFVSARRIDRTQ